MHLPRTIRIDGTDARVFDQAAEPDEWAVSGAFRFADSNPDDLTGKQRQAFARGFLGTQSFGRSTFVVVAPISLAAYESVVAALAAHFVAHYGAPSLDAALPVAREEVDFAAGLCEHPVNTLLRVERAFGDDGITERYHVVEPAATGLHAPVWELAPEQDEPD